MQNRRDPHEEVLQGEPRGQNRLPEGRCLRYQEAPLVPGICNATVFTRSIAKQLLFFPEYFLLTFLHRFTNTNTLKQQ